MFIILKKLYSLLYNIKYLLALYLNLLWVNFVNYIGYSMKLTKKIEK
jgi:hypothetical protein